MLKTALGHRAEISTELNSTVLEKKRNSLLFPLCVCFVVMFMWDVCVEAKITTFLSPPKGYQAMLNKKFFLVVGTIGLLLTNKILG